MIWLVLTGTYMAGVIAGVALVLWAEKVNEKPYSSKPPSQDSTQFKDCTFGGTNHDDPSKRRTTFAP